MLTPQYFPQGHYEPDQQVVYWEVRFSTTKPGDVALTASLQDDPTPPIFPNLRGRTATTLEFRMDRLVAMELHAKLTVLGQNMGWLPAIEG
jgi:hypothetical protein